VHQASRAYTLTLRAVERQQRGGSRQQFEPTSTNTFEDEYIKIAWKPEANELDFALTNKTDVSQRVLWDDASFVTADGKTDRIMHQGVKFADRSSSMPPTLIVHGATLDDLITPVSNVYWREGFGTYDRGGWESRPLISRTPASAAGVPGATGPQGAVKALLPLEMNGTVREYLFDFAIVESTTAPTPSTSTGDPIKIVRHREEVEQCQLLGEIAAYPPYIWPGDDLRQLRRKAAPLGADTILIPGYRVGTVQGFAYRCKAK
jgi:hypothetical protein